MMAVIEFWLWQCHFLILCHSRESGNLSLLSVALMNSVLSVE